MNIRKTCYSSDRVKRVQPLRARPVGGSGRRERNSVLALALSSRFSRVQSYEVKTSGHCCTRGSCVTASSHACLIKLRQSSHNSCMQSTHDRSYRPGVLSAPCSKRLFLHQGYFLCFESSSPLYAGRACHAHTLPKFMHKLTIIPRSQRFLLVNHRKRCPDQCSSGVVQRRGWQTRLRWELRGVVSCIGRTSFRAGRRLSLGLVTPPSFQYQAHPLVWKPSNPWKHRRDTCPAIWSILSSALWA